MAGFWSTAHLPPETVAWLHVWVDAATKGFVLVLVAALLVLALRRASAATRHLAWSLTFVGLLLLPVLSSTLPGLRVPLPASIAPPLAALVPPRQAQPSPARGPATQADRAGQPLASMRPLTEAAGAHPDAASGEATTPADAAAGVAMREGPEAALGATAGETSRSLRSRGAPRSWLAWILPVWAAGVALVAGWFALQHGSVRWLVRQASEVSEGTTPQLVRRLSARIGLRRRVRILEGDAAAMPMTWGLLRSVLLLPKGAEAWPESTRRDVLVHELAHIKRCDHVTQLLAQLACTLHWFNPLVWLAARRMHVEREHACDDCVLNAGSRPTDYAQHLLEVARSMRARRATAVAAIAMAGRSTLRDRLTAVLDDGRRRGTLGIRWTLPVLLIAAAMVVPLAALDVEPRVSATEAWAPAPLLGPVPMDVVAGRRPLEVAPAQVHPAVAPADEPVVIVGPDPDATVVVVPLPADVSGVVLGGKRGYTVESRNGVWNMNWYDGRHRLRVKAKGEIEFNEDGTNVVSVSRRGYLDIEEDDGDVERRLRMRGKRDGSVSRKWTVDGKERAYDDAAREWLAGVLPELSRRTGFGAAARVRQILEREGVEGVLDEIDHIESDHVTRAYLKELTRQTELDEKQLHSILEYAGDTIKSDYELAQFLVEAIDKAPLNTAARIAYAEASRTIGSDYEQGRALDALTRSATLEPEALYALLEAASRIGSDYEQARLLIAVAGHQELDERARRAFFDALDTISSDFEQRRVLSAVLDQPDLSPATVRDVLVSSRRRLGSDFEQAAFLIQLARTGKIDGDLVQPYIAALGTIGNDFEYRSVASALVSRNRLDDAALVDLLRSAGRQVGSDYELAELLVQIATDYDLQGDVRKAFLRASDEIGSDWENKRVMAALVEGER